MAAQTVLLIEDDEASQYIFTTILRHHGYAVSVARSGPEGLRRAREEQPALVVLDIGLPEVSGFEVAASLKAHPATREIPVLAVTVHVFEHERRRAMESGCDYFLAKPVEPRLLAAEVERILGPAAADERPPPR